MSDSAVFLLSAICCAYGASLWVYGARGIRINGEILLKTATALEWTAGYFVDLAGSLRAAVDQYRVMRERRKVLDVL